MIYIERMYIIFIIVSLNTLINLDLVYVVLLNLFQYVRIKNY